MISAFGFLLPSVWSPGRMRNAGQATGVCAALVVLFALGAPGSLLAQAPDWSFDSSSYEHTLTATAAVTIDGAPSDSGDVLGAFVGEQVRGRARPDTSTSSEQALYFLTVYGNESGQTVQFRVYDASADTVRRAERTLSFEPDATYGTPSNPYRIGIGKAELPGVEAWSVEPSAYEQTMTITASVFVEPFDRASDGPADRVAVFIEGEVRGIAESEMVGNHALFFITVYGDPPDAEKVLRLRYYDSRTDRVFPTEERDLRFSSNAVEGSPGEPVPLMAVRPSAEVEGRLQLEGISPQPLGRSTALVRFAADRRVQVQLAVYDPLGRRVQVLHRGPVDDRRTYRAWLQTDDLSSGMYFLRLSGPRTSLTEPVVVVD